MALIRPIPAFQPVRRGDANVHVKRVQEWLCLRGHPTKIDGDFGPATERALRAFCEAANRHWLGAYVDEPMMELLEQPLRRAVADLRLVNPRHVREMVCDVAEQHIAQHPREVGGQNMGPWVRLYMDGREGRQWAWCAGFVWYVIAQAAQQIVQPMPLKPSYSCTTFVERNRDKFIPGESPSLVQRGDVFFIRRDSGDNGYSHTGLVLAVDEGTILTAEGNTNDEGSREGFEAVKRARRIVRMDFLSLG